MENFLALVGKARGAVGHQAFALGGANGLAQVGFARQAELALAAFRGIQRNHMIADSDRRHAFADGFNHCATFVSQDRWKDAFRVCTGQRVGIGMTNPGGHDAQQDFTGLGHGDVDFNDLKRFPGLEGNGGA